MLMSLLLLLYRSCCCYCFFNDLLLLVVVSIAVAVDFVADVTAVAGSDVAVAVAVRIIVVGAVFDIRFL